MFQILTKNSLEKNGNLPNLNIYYSGHKKKENRDHEKAPEKRKYAVFFFWN